MALRFYSLPVQYCLSKQRNTQSSDLLSLIGIYIPCRKSDLGKTEPDLLDPFLGKLTGEHLLVTAMIAALAASLAAVDGLLSTEEEAKLRSDLECTLQWELPHGCSLFFALERAARNRSVKAQRALNRRPEGSYYENVSTFATAFQPLIDSLINAAAALRETHFSLMFDDAEDLSENQNRTLNSWIAVRDTSTISFKVATSAVDQRPLDTTSGGGLLERHDFIRVDLEQDFQNSDRRLWQTSPQDCRSSIRTFRNRGLDAEKFFPINPVLTEALEDAKTTRPRRSDCESLTGRQVRDYVHRMARALYFRARPAQANKPPYSGFDLLVHVSTGVIRYLLEPCFEMYDRAISAGGDIEVDKQGIPPSIQTECLIDMSKRRWEWIGHGFNSSIKGCALRRREADL